MRMPARSASTTAPRATEPHGTRYPTRAAGSGAADAGAAAATGVSIHGRSAAGTTLVFTLDTRSEVTTSTSKASGRLQAVTS